MINLIKRHTLTFVVGVFLITVATVVLLITDYRNLGYISFNGSIIAPVGLFAWLMIEIKESDKKHDKKGDK